MKSKIWIAGWLAIVLVITGTIGFWVYKIDPFMHYHKPNTDGYYYVLSNERSQNDGITKHFDYDALITGTSMTENFKTSEMDDVFECTSIKVPYSGGSYKEINDNLKVALTHNQNLKTIVRCLDMGYFFDEKDVLRLDLGEYPTYLYDDNPFNDVKYILNRDIIWGRTYGMVIANDADDFTPGITPFDDYARWQQGCKFGIKTVLPNGIANFQVGEPAHLTTEEKKIIKENIEQNVTSLANEYPEVDFYYFFSPYSISWWQTLFANGGIYRQIEAEQYIIELILESDNIRLFSFNNRYDITTDLNNYKDATHYGTWVNSLMLKWMHEGQYHLTKDNYKDYLAKEMEYYTSFDYMSINQQEDYENDFYSAALYNEELTGATPFVVSLDNPNFKFKNARIIENQYNGELGVECVGNLQRKSDGEYSIEDSLRENNFVGASTTVDISSDHKYLVFYGRKKNDHGQPTVMIFNDCGEMLAELLVSYHDIDEEWHQYMIDVSNLCGRMKIVFNGGYEDDTGDDNSTFIFSNICLY